MTKTPDNQRFALRLHVEPFPPGFQADIDRTFAEAHEALGRVAEPGWMQDIRAAVRRIESQRRAMVRTAPDQSE